jgi:hypothetical protein
MLTERRDYLLRLIQQAGVAAARLRERLTGEGVSPGDVAREADQEIAALMAPGPQAALIERVDADTAVRLVEDPARIGAWIDLLHVKAEALAAAGSEAAAQALRQRVTTLQDAVQRLVESKRNT